MNRLFYFLLILIASISISSEAQTITELKFPYKSGYTLNLRGTETLFQSDGTKHVDSSFTFYYINTEKVIKQNNWVNFQCNSVHGNDRTYFESLLAMNENGMLYQSHAKNSKSKGAVVQAILLPLSEGKTWNTKLEGMSAVCSCISTHTFISTAQGDIDCFCVQTIATIKKMKDYDYKMKVLEFYNQGIGKVAYNAYYYYEKSNGDVYNVMEIKEVLADYGFKEK